MATETPFFGRVVEDTAVSSPPEAPEPESTADFGKIAGDTVASFPLETPKPEFTPDFGRVVDPSAMPAEAIFTPSSLLEGIDKEVVKRIGEIGSNETLSSVRMSRYLSQTTGLDYDFVKNNYSEVSKKVGLSGNNATADFQIVSNGLAAQWGHIRETEKALGAEAFSKTLLQRAIPQVRSNIDLLVEPDWAEGLMRMSASGASNAFVSIASGFNRVIASSDKLAGEMQDHLTKAVLPSFQPKDRTSVFDDFSQYWDDLADEKRRTLDVPKEIQESILGKAAEGVGALPVWGVTMASGGAGGIALFSGMYKEGSDRYRQIVPEEQRTNEGELGFAALYGAAASKLEKIGFTKQIAPIFSGVGKLSVRQIAQRAKQFLTGTGTEITTELTENIFLNAQSMAIDPDAKVFDGITFENFVVISIVSAVGQSVPTSIGVVQDFQAGFFPSPITRDGHAPMLQTIQAIRDGVGEEALIDMHDEADPRRALIKDMLGDDPAIALDAHERYQNLTAPDPEGRSFESEAISELKKELAGSGIFSESEKQQFGFLAFSEEQIQAMEESIATPRVSSPEEQALFEAELDTELAQMTTEEIIVEADIYPQVKETRSKQEAEVVSDAVKAKTAELKLKSKEDIALLRLNAAEKLKALRVKGQAQLTAEKKRSENKLNILKSRVKLILSNVQKQKLDTKEGFRLLDGIVKKLPSKHQGRGIKHYKALALRVSGSAKIRVLDAASTEVIRLLDVLKLREVKSKFENKAESLQRKIAKAKKGSKPAGADLDYTHRLLSLMGYGDPKIASALEKELSELEIRGEEQGYQETEDDKRILFESSIFNVKREGLTTSEYEEYSGLIEDAQAGGIVQWKKHKAEQALYAKTITGTLLIEAQNSERKGIPDPEAAKRRDGLLEGLKGKTKDLLKYQSIATLMSRVKRGKWTEFFDNIATKVNEARIKQHEFRQTIDAIAKSLNIDLDIIGATFLMELNGRDISVHDAMFIYAHSQNQRGLTHLANTKYGARGKERSIRKEIDSVVSALPLKYKEMVDAIIDYHDIVMFPEMSKLNKKRFGVSMHKEERYMPIKALFTNNVFSSLVADLADYSKLRMSNQKARTGSSLGFSEFNFLGDILHNNAMSEHAIALYDSLSIADAVLSSREIQNAANAVSTEIIPWIRRWTELVGRGRMKPADTLIEKAASFLRQNVSRFYVMISPSSYLKMYGPVVAMEKDVSPHYIAGAAERMSTHPMETMARVRSLSPMMSARPHNTRIITAELAEKKLSRTPRKSLGVPIIAKARVLASDAADLGYVFFNALDTHASMIAWDASFAKGKNDGMSKPEAVKYANHIVNTYFPSGALEQMAPIFTNAGLIRQLVTFTADMNLMFNLGFSATQLKEGRVREAILFFTYSVFFSSFYLAFTDLPEDWIKESLDIQKAPDSRGSQYLKDVVRYNVSTMVGGVPIFGQTVEALVARQMGEDALARMLGQQSMVFTAPFKALAEGNPAKAVLSATGAPAGKFYANQIDDYIDEMFD